MKTSQLMVIMEEILKLFAGATMNNFQIDMAFKNNKNGVRY
jgi:hypothetical protein